MRLILISAFLGGTLIAHAQVTNTNATAVLQPRPPPSTNIPAKAMVTAIDAADLQEFSSLSPRTQALIQAALDLTRQNLRYRYGSADPAQGGMDCSGTIFYLLQSMNVPEVPRQSDEMYRWLWEKGTLNAVAGNTFDSFEFSRLEPGDLLFWTGTYTPAVKRDPPISHVMLYLGKHRATGKRLMMGASEGRRYGGVPQRGVSVFDFELPRVARSPTNTSPRFVGYGKIPLLDQAALP